MVILGLLLMAVGALAIVGGLATARGTAEYLGTEVHALTLFFLGVGATVALLWGFSLSKYGTKRSLQRRRDSRRLNELSEKLDRVEAERARAAEDTRVETREDTRVHDTREDTRTHDAPDHGDRTP